MLLDHSGLIILSLNGITFHGSVPFHIVGDISGLKYSQVIIFIDFPLQQFSEGRHFLKLFLINKNLSFRNLTKINRIPFQSSSSSTDILRYILSLSHILHITP